MATLLVKHLPPVLSEDSITEFFQHYGAIEVKIMQGKMKGNVFVTCRDSEEAKKVVAQLHGLKLVDKTLSAEIAKEKDNNGTAEPSITTTPATATPAILKPEEITETDKSQFEPIAPTLGLNYAPNPFLEYRYPTPNPLILTNILNAMTANSKFYTQVLHLMNKMNLPPPFGPPAPALPMTADGMKRKRGDEIEEEEEESSDDEELDLEPLAKRSTAGGAAPATAVTGAALAQQLIQQQQQQLTQQLLLQQKHQQEQQHQEKLQEQQLKELQQHLQQQQQQSAQLQQHAQNLALNPNAYTAPIPTPVIAPLPASALQPVIPSIPTASPAKKGAIQIKLDQPADKNALPFLMPSPASQLTQHNLSQQQQQIQQTQQQIQQQQELLQHQQRLLQQLQPNSAVPLSKYITSEEIAANRVSLAEIKNVDKKYEKGEPTVKLYIKNLAKQAEVSDLERIFGKYFPNEQAMKDGLTIKLMKEGRMKGQAFVTFTDETLAEEALEEVNGYKLHDKPMVIQYGKLK